MDTSPLGQRPIEPIATHIPYRSWLKSLGVSKVTGWRWVKLGMVRPVSLCGRLYIAITEINRFWSRAQAGEFSTTSRRWATHRTKPARPLQSASSRMGPGSQTASTQPTP